MPYVFREDNDKPMPPILGQVLRAEGWQQYDETIPAEEQPPFNLFWKTNRFYPSQIQGCKYPYQRVNHYPKSSEITKKDAMYRHMKRMKGIYGSVYNFVPTTFVLPNEYVKFCQFFADERDKIAPGERLPVYICKPSELSRGRKIFVFDDIGDLTYDCSSVVQKYVSNPLLIKGHKFDLRIYVLVTSFQPLRAYIYDDFLTRFSVERYNLDEVKNIFAHLTNYSISKTSTNQDDAVLSGIGALCKWERNRTREYFASVGIDFDLMWTRIENLVCLTLLSICNQVPTVPQCFELYGFDVLFDESFAPWLMEVNFSPALAVESDVDQKVKGPLMRDLVNTLHIKEFEVESECGDDEDRKGDEKQQQQQKTRSADPPPSAARPTGSAGAARSVSRKVAPPRAPASSSSSGGGGGGGDKTRSAAAAKPLSGRSGAPPAEPALRMARSSSTVRAAAVAGPSAASTALPKAAGSGVAGATALRRANSVTSSHRLSNAAAASSSVPSQSSDDVAVSAGGVELVDRPEGGFRWVFPFSPLTEEISVQMGRTLAEPLLRQLITEVKKREAKAAAAMKEYPAIYAANTTGGTSGEVMP